MIRRSMPALPFLLALLGPVAGAQQPGRAYKVAFWFEMDRPLSSLQYRAYDLARGEYDKAAVDRWQTTIREKHPSFGATVRDLSTSGEPGATEAERLTNAIAREKRRWVELNSRASYSARSRFIPPPTTKAKDKEVGRASFDRPSPGSPGPIANPPGSPFPYPYHSGPR
jgi:hypothetical protein